MLCLNKQYWYVQYYDNGGGSGWNIGGILDIGLKNTHAGARQASCLTTSARYHTEYILQLMLIQFNEGACSLGPWETDIYTQGALPADRT